MRATLSADHTREHHEAHARNETVTNLAVRAADVVGWATRGGAHALGLEDVVGSLEAGKLADVVLVKNDESPVMFPLLNPYGHVVFQAQRGDVHTVVVNGRVVKHEHRLVDADLAKARRVVEETVGYLQDELGASAWEAGMNPDIPESKVLDNPYTYTDYADSSTHQR
jgi:cytosine/adenosine deaminase-related metal-dependent hydrolase